MTGDGVTTLNEPLQKIRRGNEKRVIEALKAHGTLTRAQLCQQSELSRTTMYRILRSLRDNEVISERICEHTTGVRGRPTSVLSLNPVMGAVLGIELGRSQAAVVVMNYAGAKVGEGRVRFEHTMEWDESMSALLSLVHEVGQELDGKWSGLKQVFVGLHGLMPSSENFVDSSERDTRIRSLITALDERLATPIMVESNTRLAAIAEYEARALENGNLLYCHLSRGVGSALLIGGEAYRGSSNSAGEFGHMCVDPRGQPCRCGGRGCLETVVGIDHVLNRAQAIDGSIGTFNQLCTGHYRRSGSMRKMIEVTAQHLGQAVGNVCNVFDPGEVVLGGELVDLGDEFINSVRRSISRVVLMQVKEQLNVSVSRLGSDAAATGAALMGLRRVLD